MEAIGSHSYQQSPPTSVPFYQELGDLRTECKNGESDHINYRTIDRFLSTYFEQGDRNKKFNALIDLSLELHMSGQQKVASYIYTKLKEHPLLSQSLCEQAGLYYWHLAIKTDIQDFIKWFQSTANDKTRPIATCFFATAIMEHKHTIHNLKVAIGYFEKSVSWGYQPADARLQKARLILNGLEHPEPTSNAHSKFNALLDRAKFDRKETSPSPKRASLPAEQTVKPMIRSHSSPADINHKSDAAELASVPLPQKKSGNDAVELPNAPPPPPKKKSGFRSRGHSKSVDTVPESVKNKRRNPFSSLHPNQAGTTRSASGSPASIKTMPSIKEENAEDNF